ncbi:MAG: hypothetical protein Q8L56_07885 [Rhodocyclaceae bacterium]|nr:hypothetical protein [Rhodocyclaceae bacterium]
MDTAAIQVLLREAGYLRLRLPPELRSREAGTMIESGLKSLTGVVRVTLLTAEGKLAVRFDSSLTSHAAIALRLKALLAGLPQAEAASPPAEPLAVAPEAGLAARLDDLREKLVAATPARFRPLVESATTEKAVTNFFNDIVAFYLIKTHWDLITKYWIRDPVKYGNAWLTVFYMVFLLVRYRKS